MTVTKAQKEATARYEAKVYDKVLLRLKRGKKDEIEQSAKAAGETINGFITAAIETRLSGTPAPATQPTAAPEESTALLRPDDQAKMEAHLDLYGLDKGKFIHRAINSQIESDKRARMLNTPIERDD